MAELDLLLLLLTLVEAQPRDPPCSHFSISDVYFDTLKTEKQNP